MKLCKDCKHSHLPFLDDNGHRGIPICKYTKSIFKTDYYNGEHSYYDCATMRHDSTMCSGEAIYFEENVDPISFLKKCYTGVVG